jgi:hypothetical protein
MAFTNHGLTLDSGFKSSTSGQSGHKTWRVSSDVPVSPDEIDSVLAAPGLPSVGSSWSIARPSLVVTDLIPSYNGDADRTFQEFTVRANYETPTGGDDPEPDPTARAWVINFTSNKENIVAERVVTASPGGYGDFQGTVGDGVANSALDPYNPPPEIPRALRVITLSKNFSHSAFTGFGGEAFLRPFIDSMNSDAVTIASLPFDLFQGYCQDIDHSPESENGVDYVKVTLVFVHDDETYTPVGGGGAKNIGHLTLIRDAGFNDIEGEITITDSAGDDTGIAVTEPWPLNGAGLRLSRTDPNQAYYGCYGLLKSKAWAALISGLSIPTTYP